MRLLITGGSGFVGTHLIRAALEKGYQITVLDRKAPRTEAKVRYVKGDVRSQKSVKEAGRGADAVAHLAAEISIPSSFENPEGTMSTNVMGTLNVLDANKSNDIVFVSSAAVYGSPVKLPINEGHPLNPISPYGLSKVCAEECCRFYSNVFGTRVAVLRPFNIYGKGQPQKSPYSGVMSRFINSASSGRPLTVFGDGKQTRDFVYVEDVCEAILKAIGSSATFNIGTGKGTSINSLAKLILGFSNKQLHIVHVRTRQGDIRHSVADISKAKAGLRWRPKTCLEAGIRKMVMK